MLLKFIDVHCLKGKIVFYYRQTQLQTSASVTNSYCFNGYYPFFVHTNLSFFPTVHIHEIRTPSFRTLFAFAVTVKRTKVVFCRKIYKIKKYIDI